MTIPSLQLDFNIQPPDLLLSWLKPNKSPLIKRLQEIDKTAKIECIRQAWTDSCLWDKQVLNLQEKILRREVLARAGAHICWYGRTLIPQSCYALNPNFFERLKNEPLTNLVYNEPQVQKIHFLYYAFTKECMEFYWVQSYNNEQLMPLWARISTFEFQKKSCFFLIEIFLPDLLELYS